MQNASNETLFVYNADSTLEEELKKLMEIDWDLDAEEMLDGFETEALQAAKVEVNTLVANVSKQATKAIEQGLDFSEFRENLILSGYEAKNPYYLRTQFNTAINGSFAGGQRKGIQADIDIFPALRYVSVLIETTREEHAAAHDTIPLLIPSDCLLITKWI